MSTSESIASHSGSSYERKVSKIASDLSPAATSATRKKKKQCLDICSDSSGEDEIGKLKKELSKKEATHKQLHMLEFKILHLKAIIWSYRTKAKKMRSLAMAGITREDVILEDANGKFERGKLEEDCVSSDDEDNDRNNQVQYSYIDNQLFMDED